MEKITDLKLYNIISKIGLIDQEILDVSLKSAKAKKVKFSSFLIKQNLIKSSEIARLISNHLKVPFVDLSKQKIENKIAKLETYNPTTFIKIMDLKIDNLLLRYAGIIPQWFESVNSASCLLAARELAVSRARPSGSEAADAIHRLHHRGPLLKG